MQFQIQSFDNELINNRNFSNYYYCCGWRGGWLGRCVRRPVVKFNHRSLTINLRIHDSQREERGGRRVAKKDEPSQQQSRTVGQKPVDFRSQLRCVVSIKDNVCHLPVYQSNNNNQSTTSPLNIHCSEIEILLEILFTPLAYTFRLESCLNNNHRRKGFP